MTDDTDDVLTVVDTPRDERVVVDDAQLATTGERYELVGRIGKGGMGEIDLCKDTRIARHVARKVLRRKLRRDPAYRTRFLFEARLQGQLEHPSIVPVHDLGEGPNGELYFTMKRVRGMTLDQALKAAKRGQPAYTQRRLLTAFTNVCLAIDFAHTRGVVHRDLKPHNIMLGDFGEVYVLDWGIAKLMGREDTPMPDVLDVPGSDTPTRAGTVLGTPPYMAPERAAGVADPRTDVYSLGVILGEILESQQDFDIAPELALIAVRASQADPTLRYQTARELHDAIDRYLEGDRDLEARRKLSEQHANRAEQALTDGTVKARTTSAREIGRALGLDPANRRALQTLMRLLSEVPAELPNEVKAEIDRRWLERRSRVMMIGSAMTLSMLSLAPLIVWSGVRDWGLFGAFVAAVLAAAVCQVQASRRPSTVWYAIAFVVQLSAAVAMTPSCGLMGVVPAAFTIQSIAWRMTSDRTIHGVLIIVAILAAVLVPFAFFNQYEVRDGTLIILPHMNHFARMPMLACIIVGTWGVAVGAVLFGRLFVGEIRRAESQLRFHAWQLQQLVPPA